MKKIICVLLLVILTAALFAGCGNKVWFDTQRTFDYAIVEFPSGEVKTIEIDTWNDYEGEQIQITAKDGNVYLVSSFNCVLVDKD